MVLRALIMSSPATVRRGVSLAFKENATMRAFCVDLKSIPGHVDCFSFPSSLVRSARRMHICPMAAPLMTRSRPFVAHGRVLHDPFVLLDFIFHDADDVSRSRTVVPNMHTPSPTGCRPFNRHIPALTVVRPTSARRVLLSRRSPSEENVFQARIGPRFIRLTCSVFLMDMFSRPINDGGHQISPNETAIVLDHGPCPAHIAAVAVCFTKRVVLLRGGRRRTDGKAHITRPH